MEIEHRIILECSNHGIVNQVILDKGSFLENITLPVGLHSIVSPTSIKELGDFWISIQEKSMGENTILSLRFNDQEQTFIFSGYLLHDTVLLCGKTEMTSIEKALEEIMLINNEQANQIRLSEKKAGLALKNAEKKEINDAILNDFSSLNNELINSKRELMRKNQKIEALNQELQAVNENLSMFTYSVSHDLTEPVRMVKSFLTKLKINYGDSLDQKGQLYMDFASDGAKRIGNMLEDLLEYHRTSNQNPAERVDLNEVYGDVLRLLQKQIELKNAVVSSEKLPVVKGSKTGFQQVIQNLLSNAIKFVPEGKTPMISIQSEENELNHIIKVSDNGIGIAENKNEEIFNLFKRLNGPQQFEGTGMGLAIVKKSMEKMGGKIWLESTPDVGTTFYFSIPKNDK